MGEGGRLGGRVAPVTGGASGPGRAAAAALDAPMPSHSTMPPSAVADSSQLPPLTREDTRA